MPKDSITRHQEQGWSKDWGDMQNDAGETDVGKAFSTGGLGDEMDEAFRRGRTYCTKGYGLKTAKGIVKKKTKEYQKEFLRGWKWQNDRKPKKKAT